MRILSKIPVFVFTLLFLMGAGAGLAGEVIQSQEAESVDGIEVDLTSVKMKNDIVTLKFKIRNVGSKSQNVEIPYKSCFLMDETNQKKYYILKDSDGIFIAGPLNRRVGGGQFSLHISPGKSKNMWMKFPAPPDNPETVTISIEGVLPFEDVKLPK